MKYYVAILFLVCNLFTLKAQNLSGITGIRDTSFTLKNELAKHIGKYPFIKLVELQANSTIQQQEFTYCTVNKKELKLDVFYPLARVKKKRTAIIFIHGGGWRSGDKSIHQPLMQRLAAIGYVGITPQYRLSTEALYPAAIEDIKAVIRWTRKNAATYNIDPNKIVIAGHSAGGELAAFMGVTNGKKEYEGSTYLPKISSRVNAVIDVDGTLSFVHAESSEMKDLQKRGASALWLGYTPMENMDIFKQASPLTHVDSHCPPILFLNSSVERMHAGRDDFIKVLESHNIYSEVKTFGEAPHSFCFFEPWFSDMVNTIDSFLKKTFS